MVRDGTKRGYRGDLKPAVLLRDQLHLSIRLSLRQGDASVSCTLSLFLSCLFMVTWQASANTGEQREEATHWDEMGLWRDALPCLQAHTNTFSSGCLHLDKVMHNISANSKINLKDLFRKSLIILIIFSPPPFVSTSVFLLFAFHPLLLSSEGKVDVRFRVMGCQCWRSTIRGSLYCSYTCSLVTSFLSKLSRGPQLLRIICKKTLGEFPGLLQYPLYPLHSIIYS